MKTVVDLSAIRPLKLLSRPQRSNPAARDHLAVVWQYNKEIFYISYDSAEVTVQRRRAGILS